MIKFQLGTHDVPENISQVVVITQKNNAQDYNLPIGITQKADKYITDKENGFITLYEKETIRLVAVFGKDEPDVSQDSEEIRLFGAALLKALQNEKVVEVQIKALNNAFSTCERNLFIEGMSLAQYRFDKYKKSKNESCLQTVYLDENAVVPGEIEALHNLVKSDRKSVV